MLASFFIRFSCEVKRLVRYFRVVLIILCSSFAMLFLCNALQTDISVSRAKALYTFGRYADSREMLELLFADPLRIAQMDYNSKKDLHVYLAAARFHTNDEDSARQAVAILAKIDPNYDFTRDQHLFENDSTFQKWFPIVWQQNFGSAEIISDPPGGKIYIDGKTWSEGQTPKRIEKLFIGQKHKAKVIIDGFPPDSCEFAVSFNTPIKVEFNFRKIGSMLIQSKPDGAKIFINNEETSRGVTPKKIDSLAVGDYSIKLIKGDIEKVVSCQVFQDSLTTILVDLHKPGWIKRNKWWLAGGVPVLGVASYAVIKLLNKEEKSKPLPLPPEPPK